MVGHAGRRRDTRPRDSRRTTGLEVYRISNPGVGSRVAGQGPTAGVSGVWTIEVTGIEKRSVAPRPTAPSAQTRP